LTYEWIKKNGYAFNKLVLCLKEILPYLSTIMNMEAIILSEIIVTEEQTLHDSPYVR
jgi:hypothetical protein